MEEAFIVCRTLPQVQSCDPVAKEEGPVIVRGGCGAAAVGIGLAASKHVGAVSHVKW